jgi:hypothetical protein
MDEDCMLSLLNCIFNNYNRFHETALRIIVVMLAYDKMYDFKEFDKNTISKYTGLSLRSIWRYMKEVLPTNIFYIKSRNKSNGNYVYAINYEFIGNDVTLIDFEIVHNLYCGVQSLNKGCRQQNRQIPR